MLPCIVKDFFLNNQPDALNIQIYSVIKLYMFRASSLPIIRISLLYIHSALVKFHAGFWWPFPNEVRMELLGSGHQKPAWHLTSAECTVEKSWSSQRPLPDNTQHSQQTDISGSGGIRTHNLSKRVAAPQLGPAPVSIETGNFFAI